MGYLISSLKSLSLLHVNIYIYKCVIQNYDKTTHVISCLALPPSPWVSPLGLLQPLQVNAPSSQTWVVLYDCDFSQVCRVLVALSVTEKRKSKTGGEGGRKERLTLIQL